MVHCRLLPVDLKQGQITASSIEFLAAIVSNFARAGICMAQPTSTSVSESILMDAEARLPCLVLEVGTGCRCPGVGSHRTLSDLELDEDIST